MDSIEELYTAKGILKDSDFDGVADGLNGYVLLKENSNMVEKKIAINLCARLGFEVIGLKFPLLKFSDEFDYDTGINIVIDKDFNQTEVDEHKAVISLLTKENAQYIVLSAGSERALSVGGEYLYSRLPFVYIVKNGNLKLSDVSEDIRKKLSLDKVYIVKVIVDDRFLGLAECEVCIKADNADKILEYIRQNPEEFRWPFIGGIKFTVSDIKHSKSLLVKGGELKEKDRLNEDILEENIVRFEEKSTDIDLSNILTTEGLFKDYDGDFQPDTLNSKIVISNNAGKEEVLAACNIAARLGLETLGITFPVTCLEKEFTDEMKNPIFIGGKFDDGSISLKRKNRNNLICIGGKGEDLLRVSNYFSKTFPNITDSGESIELKDIKSYFIEVFKANNFEGQIAAMYSKLENMKDLKGKTLTAFLDIDDEKLNVTTLQNHIKEKYGFKSVSLKSRKNGRIVFKKHYEIPWEVDSFQDILKKEVFPKVKTGDKIYIFGLLSEEGEIRNKLKDNIYGELLRRGLVDININIFCSYKQGLSWIMEGIIPKIKVLKNKIGRIVIRFAPFLKEKGSMKEFEKYSGVIPDYTSHDDQQKDRWFDLPVRWLQELYPVDDLISEEIGISRDRITFEMVDKLGSTYQIVVKDKDDNEIFKDDFLVRYSEIPYLVDFPEIGKVHPPTSWIQVKLNDEIIVDKSIKTDLEEIWDIYQGEILKECKEFVLKKTNGQITSDKQPFFKELRFDITVSEPDYDLGIREDRISSLDALHEDIYFVGLDFFKTLGERNSKVSLTEPGLILPYIEKRNGKPGSMEVTLSEEYPETQGFFVDEKWYNLTNDKKFELLINSIRPKEKGIDKIGIELISHEEYDELYSIAKCFCDLNNHGLLSYKYLENVSIKNIILKLTDDESERKSELFLEVKKSNKKAYCKVEHEKLKMLLPPQNRVIGYDEYIDIIESIKNIPGINVWKAGKSYRGRDIYAVDITSNMDADIVSKSKIINFKPTYMLVNRHHANEVSSTNSALELIYKMAYDEDYRKYLKKINLVIIPFENVDGGHIHYLLQKQNPCWKLHVARFNSVGKEIAWDYWKDSKYGESKAFPRAWSKWLPDIVVDNHGVPSHEWDQPFSGYVSPWFKGFWLPRALFYGYFWYVDSPEYPYHKKLNEYIQESVASKLNNDDEIKKWNAEWKDRFKKYAHNWMPKMFPANYYKNLIFYWIPYKPNPDSFHVSHKYPWITAVDWTTEVSDETAQGDYLRLCSKTHHIADMAVIELLSTSKKKIEDLSSEKGGIVTLKKIRRRPIHFD